MEDAVAAVKRWFHGREGRWLVILDSADTIDDDQQKSYIDLDYFIPNAPGVHIIITSRSLIAKEMTTLDAVEVADMEPPEAIELFQRYAKQAFRDRVSTLIFCKFVETRSRSSNKAMSRCSYHTKRREVIRPPPCSWRPVLYKLMVQDLGVTSTFKHGSTRDQLGTEDWGDGVTLMYVGRPHSPTDASYSSSANVVPFIWWYK